MGDSMTEVTFGKKDVENLKVRLAQLKERKRKTDLAIDRQEWVQLTERLIANPELTIGIRSGWVADQAREVGLTVKIARIECPFLFEISVPELEVEE
jgi:hypothetical protein